MPLTSMSSHITGDLLSLIVNCSILVRPVKQEKFKILLQS